MQQYRSRSGHTLIRCQRCDLAPKLRSFYSQTILIGLGAVAVSVPVEARERAIEVLRHVAQANAAPHDVGVFASVEWIIRRHERSVVHWRGASAPVLLVQCWILWCTMRNAAIHGFCNIQRRGKDGRAQFQVSKQVVTTCDKVTSLLSRGGKSEISIT